MSSNGKIALEEVRMLAWFALGWVYWMASAHASREKRPSFPTLRCAACGGQMRVVSVTHCEVHLTLANHALAYLDSG
jgi:hypothetical protein